MELMTYMKKKIRKYSKVAKFIKDYIEEEILQEYDVTLEEEYRAGNGMRYDFCFPYLEEMVAIEADGIQHDKYVPFFHGSEEGFEQSKARDFHKDFNTMMKRGHIIRIKDRKDWSSARPEIESKLESLLWLFEKGDVKKK